MGSQFYKPRLKKKKTNPKTIQCIEDRNILQTLQNMWTAIKIILCVAPELGHFNLPYPDCMIQASHPSLFPGLSHPRRRHYLWFFRTGKTLQRPSFLLILVNLFRYPSIHPSCHPSGTSAMLGQEQNRACSISRSVFFWFLVVYLFAPCTTCLSVSPVCARFQATSISQISQIFSRSLC